MSDILKSSHGVSTLLRLWIKDKALTDAEVVGVLKRMLSPAELRGITYAGQVIARLSELVDDAVRERAIVARRSADAARLTGPPNWAGQGPNRLTRRLVEGIGEGGEA